MKKLIFILPFLVACGNQPSKETQRLTIQLDSIKKFNHIFEKYTNFKTDLMLAGAEPKEAKRVADSSFKEQHPIPNAEWMK